MGTGLLAAAQSGLHAQNAGRVVVNPEPLFDVSPCFYLQFMEPLGITDGSVEAAWDYDTDDWRKDFVDVVRGLSPSVIRWGGLYSRYYKWREGVGDTGPAAPGRATTCGAEKRPTGWARANSWTFAAAWEPSHSTASTS